MSFASTLFSESQARIYRWVRGQPERSFHLSDLRRPIGLGSASLQRELNALVDAGLLRSERLGNLRHFRANANSPVFPKLVWLTCKSLGAEPVLREALLILASDLQGAWLYGPVAKKSDNASSDVDLMLAGRNPQLAKVLELLLPAEAQPGRKINPVSHTPAGGQAPQGGEKFFREPRAGAVRRGFDGRGCCTCRRWIISCVPGS